jgi:heptosyltransferase-3
VDILFITHTRIGDAVMSTGLLRHLIVTYPQARFTIACGPLAAPLFAATPNVARVIVVAKQPFDLHWYRLWKALRGTVWDMAVDLRRSLMTYIIPVRGRHRVGPIAPGVHHVAHLSAMLGLRAPVAPYLYTGSAHQTRAAELIPDGARVLALAPVAATVPKTWAPERFAELAARLTAPGAPCAGWRVALFGGPGDAEKAAALRTALPDAVAIFNEPDLLTVQAALARCRAFVGNDSGLAHLASSAGLPVLALFGPTDPARYGPWGGAAVRAADRTLAGLSVDEVETAFRRLMTPA